MFDPTCHVCKRTFKDHHQADSKYPVCQRNKCRNEDGHLSLIRRFTPAAWSDSCTPRGVFYDWGLAGPGGAAFWLYRRPSHTKEDINKSKSWLRNRQDVVGGIRVYEVEERDICALSCDTKI
jgi:hypothetical protein